MTMLVAIALVGLGSYLLRVIPLLLGDRVRLSPHVRDVLGYAVLASMTALLVAMVLPLAGAQPDRPGALAAPWIALLAGTIAAALRQSMGRVLLIGMAVFASVTLLASVL